MNANKIIKALECSGSIGDSTCKGCTYHETYNASCVVRLMCDAIDLINRQKAEIDRYKGVIKLLEQDVATAKAEAYKEFAERLKEKMQSSVTMAGENVLSVHPKGIDNLLKEMTEGNGNVKD